MNEREMWLLEARARMSLINDKDSSYFQLLERGVKIVEEQQMFSGVVNSVIHLTDAVKGLKAEAEAGVTLKGLDARVTALEGRA